MLKNGGIIVNVVCTAILLLFLCRAFLQMLEEEGIQAFYRSYRTTLIMNVPFTAVHFATYEAAKKILGRRVADEDRLETHLLAGGAAGALASAVTNPMDVVKTRLQCQVRG